MRRVIIHLSLLLNIILLILLGYVCSQKNPAVISNKKSDNKASTYSVAVLQPISHPALDKIRKGFVETISKQNGIICNFRVYNANGNRSLMRAQLEEIIQKKFDLIYSIGARATQMAKEVTTKKGALIPIVFGAVARPEELKLVENNVFSGNHLTGSSTSTNYHRQIDYLFIVRPNIKKLLIIYDPTQSSGLERDVQEIKKILKNRNVTVKAVEVYKTNEIIKKVSLFIPQYDVALILKDNTVVPAVDGLVKLCSRSGTTLYATDLDSVYKGAALGFGIKEYDFGRNAAACALKILIDGKKPSQVPIFFTDSYRLKINTKTMKQQKVDLDPKLLGLMRSIEVS